MEGGWTDTQTLCPGFPFRRKRRMCPVTRRQITAHSLMASQRQRFPPRSEEEKRKMLADHHRSRPLNPQNPLGAPSVSGLPQHRSPGRTVRTADIHSLCMDQERRMQTLQRGRHTMLAQQHQLMRSMYRLCVQRPGGKWSVSSRPRGNAGELSLPMCPKPEMWLNQISTPGSLSTCAASLLAVDRTQTNTHADFRRILDTNNEEPFIFLTLKFKTITQKQSMWLLMSYHSYSEFKLPILNFEFHCVPKYFLQEDFYECHMTMTYFTGKI